MALRQAAYPLRVNRSRPNGACRIARPKRHTVSNFLPKWSFVQLLKYLAGDRRRARLRELEDKVARLDGVYPSQSDQSDGYPLLSATGNLVPLLGNPSPASSPRDWHPTGLNPSIMPSSDGDLSLVGLTTWLDPARPGGYSIQTSSNATQFADSFFPGQLPIANAHRESMLENPSSLMDTQSEKPRSQRDILIFRPGGKTVSAQPRQLRQRILALPQAARDELRDWAKNGNFSFVDTFHYLVEDGNGHGSPLTHLHQHPGATASYSPYRNVLHMARISYFAALFANLALSGLTLLSSSTRIANLHFTAGRWMVALMRPTSRLVCAPYRHSSLFHIIPTSTRCHFLPSVVGYWLLCRPTLHY